MKVLLNFHFKEPLKKYVAEQRKHGNEMTMTSYIVKATVEKMKQDGII